MFLSRSQSVGWRNGMKKELKGGVEASDSHNCIQGSDIAARHIIRLLNPDEYEAWDCFVDKSPQGTIFHKTWWLYATASERGGQFNILGYFDSSDQLAGGLPLYRPNARHLFPDRICHPALTPYLGPVLKDCSELRSSSRIGVQKEILNALICGLSDYGDIRFSPHYSLADGQPFLWQGFILSVGYTYVLNLRAGIEALWEQTDSRVRNDVRRAQKHGLRVVTERPLSDFLRLNRQTFERQRLQVPYSDELLVSIHRAAAQRESGAVFYAENAEREVCGAVFIVWDQRSAYYLAGGLHPDRKSSGAVTLALWEAIQQMANRGLPRFDFEGSDVPGIEKFFRGFGGDLMPKLIATRTKSLRAALERDARSYARRIRDWFSAHRQPKG
jgi:hypothetical protein